MIGKPVEKIFTFHFGRPLRAVPNALPMGLKKYQPFTRITCFMASESQRYGNNSAYHAYLVTFLRLQS